MLVLNRKPGEAVLLEQGSESCLLVVNSATHGRIRVRMDDKQFDLVHGSQLHWKEMAITVTPYRHGRVSLAFDGPRDVRVRRWEILVEAMSCGTAS